MKESSRCMGELGFQRGPEGARKSTGSRSVNMVCRLRLMEGLRLSNWRLTESSMTDSMCFSDVILPLVQAKMVSSVPLACRCCSVLRDCETMESLRLEEERDEARSVVLVWLRSLCRRIQPFNFIMNSRFLIVLLITACHLETTSQKDSHRHSAAENTAVKR